MFIILYVENKIVIKLTNVINVKADLSSILKDTPNPIMIKENSLTWAKLIPVKKDVLFVYLKIPIKIKTINGLINKTNKDKSIAGNNKDETSLI